MKRGKRDDERGFFDINEYELDKEWIRQPKLYHDWAVKLADAKLDLEEEKANLDVLTAEIDQEIRSDPDKFGLEKVTEAAIKNIVPLQDAYQKAQASLRQARHRVDVMSATVTALDHRKRALQDLVALHGQNYFSVPKAREGSEEAVESMNKRAARRPRNRS